MFRKYRAMGATSLVVAFAMATLSGSSCAINEIGLGSSGSESGLPPATCTDGIKNGDETDNDCGGSCTETCTEGKTCGAGSDCSSTFCNSGVCVAECSNSAKDGDETDIDCGGSCAKCADGLGCTNGADCQSGVCLGTHQCAMSTCSDGVHNSTETDLDCGGSCATKCSGGRACLADADCVSGVCSSAVCVPDPVTSGCFDALKNGLETDVNCGGGACPGCTTGQSCLLDSDCAKSLKCKGAPSITTCQLP